MEQISRNINIEHHENLSVQERLGLRVTKIVGTMQFFYILVLWQIGWMGWQMFFISRPFDPYPFAFLLFMSNIIQLIFLPLLAVGQRVLNKHSELQAEHDYEINLHNEQEIERLHQKVDSLIQLGKFN